MNWLVTHTDGAEALNGTPVEALLAAADSLRSGSWMPAALDVVVAGIDVADAGSAFISDAAGPDGRRGWAVAAGASSLVTGWVVDHLKPLQWLLDEVVGDSESVRAASSTLIATATTFGTSSDAAGTTCTSWKGKAADAEHRLKAQVAATSAGVASLLNETARGMNAAAAAVDVVRGIIEGLIADLVAKAVQKAAVAAVPVLGTAIGATWLAADVLSTTNRIKEAISSLRTLADLLQAVLKVAMAALQKAARWMRANRPDAPTVADVGVETFLGVRESVKHEAAQAEQDQSAVNSMP